MRRILFFALISLMLPSGKSEDEDKNENSDSKDGQNKDEGSDKNLSTLQDKLKKMRDDDKDNFNNLPGYIKKLISPSIKDQKNKKDEQGNKEGESSKDTSESRSGRTGGEGASNPPKDNKNDDGNRSPQSLLIREVSSNIPQPIKNVDVRFSDVIGIDEFRHEFEEIVDFLKSPEKYKNAGARIPKGVLLVGAPGCGKTLMAKALAGESSCSFFYKSASEFEEVYVGVGASRMRGLFTAAKKHAPSIIFIDELDSLAGKREAFSRSNNRQCINQMLAEMDGFRKNDSVIVIGATNLEQSLDPAIKRSGRFDKVVRIPHPDRKGRESILSYYGQKIKMKGVDLHLQAKRTIGFTGADLKNFLNIAILRAVKLDREYAINDDFDFAYDRIKMGIRRAGLLADLEEKRATAIHEVGHALVCEKTAGAMPLYKVTILPSGHSLGHVSSIFFEMNFLSQFLLIFQIFEFFEFF